MTSDTRQEGFCWIEKHFKGFEGGGEKVTENSNQYREKGGYRGMGLRDSEEGTGNFFAQARC